MCDPESCIKLVPTNRDFADVMLGGPAGVAAPDMGMCRGRFTLTGGLSFDDFCQVVCNFW
jgi:hypothetical protein